MVLLLINAKSQNPQLAISFHFDSISSYQPCNIVNTTNFHLAFYGTATNINPLNDSLIFTMHWGDGTIYSDTFNFYSNSGGMYWYVDRDSCKHNYQYPGIYSLTCIIKSKLTSASDTMILNNYAMVGTSCDTITGKLHQDTNYNCLYDIGESDYYTNLQLYYNNDLLKYPNYRLNYFNGGYKFYVVNGIPVMSQYKVKVISNGNNNTICPASGSYTINSLPSNNNDFGFQCINNQTDLFCNFIGGGIGILFNQSGGLWINLNNAGCNSGNGKLKLILDPRVHAGSYSSPYYQTVIPALTGDTIVWPNNTYIVYYPTCYFINLISNPTVNIGDTLIFKTIIEGVNSETFLNNNIDTFKIVARASWDPNDIQVNPIGKIPNNTTLDYYIRFQNTGNAASSKVIVIDTLDASLNINSVVFKGSKHLVDIEKLQGNVLKFTFNPIYLPDSGSNNIGSMGFIAFSVNPTGYLPIGSQILNKAYIYFDSNPAVITNTVVNTIDSASNEPTIINNTKNNILPSIYPNPATDFLQIENISDKTVIAIYSIDGKLQKSHTVAENGIVKIKELAEGIYFIKFQNEKGIVCKKFIKNKQ